MCILGIIIARAGSKGLPDKCVRPLNGRPVIAYTINHARQANRLTDIILSTDSEPAKKIARSADIKIINRPPDLANDDATVDAVLRHAVTEYETTFSNKPVDAVALLYGNVPLRSPDIIDRCIRKWIETNADSVRTVAPVSKQHPDWIHSLHGDKLNQFRKNNIHRRQDLSPLYYHDGAVAVISRRALFAADPRKPQSFWGDDRRAIIQDPGDSVDIDTAADLEWARHLLSRQATPRPKIKIGTHVIGQSRKPYVIAEAGVNHNGSEETAIELITVAKLVGADAVKFQVFRAASLATATAATAMYQSNSTGQTTQQQMLKQLELSDETLARLAEHAGKTGIDLIATPFNVEDVPRVLALNPPAIKIASTDLNNRPLLTAVAESGKPIILSTGASTIDEIDQAVADLAARNALHRLVLLHCVSRYPTPLEEANLGAINQLFLRYNIPVGYSDHTTDESTGAFAVTAGATMLEKHLTLDCHQPGPDHAMSMTPDALRRYIAVAHLAADTTGPGILGMNQNENEVRRIARKSIVANRPLNPGDTITEDMLTLKRPGTGIPPTEWNNIIGRLISKQVPSDTPISWDMIK